ncbi:hypothetical protein WOLCODRAFT_19131 [Wolfiporia cocos MD-104 SS10]|uniref:Uncharacterized protein n=1 Tax=Wolfiporia cocos (strain MD-104) TaxID=742152 RepID=A0A2H3K8H3_WOLCO|nr:hypothetical protein WOLCODRAFT_19131 [Wolfiporia cocos MD-104 SS10]
MCKLPSNVRFRALVWLRIIDEAIDGRYAPFTEYLCPQSQYAAAARVPLIKSPSLRVPKPVERPPDIHPLPDDVTAYFVYPFTLEPHILRLEDSRRATLAAHAARRTAFLQSRAEAREKQRMRAEEERRRREEEEEQRRREALRRIAPGFEPSGGPLVPVKRASAVGPELGQATAQGGAGHERSRSVMDDLVDHLAALDSNREGP